MTAGLRALGIATVSVLALTFTPLPNLLAQWAEVDPRLQRADAIVVLGNGIRSDGSLGENSLRGAMHGIDLLEEGWAPLLVFSGNREGEYHEAEVRARLARKVGVAADSILTETNARTTREEAVRIAGRLRPRGVKKILLVTSPFHLARAVPLFERAGFEVLPAPSYRASFVLQSPEERLNLLRSLLTEVAARLYYRVGGYL